jgi:hypothetical protein
MPVSLHILNQTVTLQNHSCLNLYTVVGENKGKISGSISPTRGISGSQNIGECFQ